MGMSMDMGMDVDTGMDTVRAEGGGGDSDGGTRVRVAMTALVRRDCMR